MLRLADREVDRREARGRRGARHQRAQLLERIRLELGEKRIQAAFPDQPFFRCSANTEVAMPPRTLKRASSRIQRGLVARARSSRMRLVTASWNAPSSR